VLGVSALVGITAAALLLVAAPEKRGLRPDGDPVAAATPPAPPCGFTLPAAVRTRTFWLLYAAMLIGALGAFFPFVYLVQDAEAHGIHPVTASLLLSLIGAGSIAGRVLMGGWADRIGRKWGFALALAGMGLFLAFWLVADQVWSLALFAFGFGVWYGSFAALAPALGADYFGARHLGLILGVLYTSLAPGAFLGPTLAGWAYDLDQSYTIPIVAGVLTMALALGCTLLLPDPRRRATPAAVGVAPLSPTHPP
jgi:predicted MFS family arabinose efflux permease